MKLEIVPHKVHVRLEDLRESAWIGFGAAVEWMACRGRAMSVEVYDDKIDQAVRVLVDSLAKLGPSTCEALVEGIKISNETAVYELLPHGLWPLVSVNDAEFDDFAHHLSLVGGVDEWGGEITDRFGDGYTRLRIRSSYVLEISQSTMRGPDPTDSSRQKPRQSSDRLVRMWLEKLVLKVPERLAPLTIKETEQITREKFPKVSRDIVRKIYAQIVPKRAPGPRGKRIPNRKQLFGEFCQKVNSAELQK